jgi:Zn ribbon nucleic-acid-binding protein
MKSFWIVDRPTKCYFVLDCPNQQAIANSLYDFYKDITAGKEIKDFWNTLTKKEIKEYFSKPDLEIKKWFNQLELNVRDMSFTVYDTNIHTSIHTDAPPVIAKINFPVLNTQDTYNIWYNDNGEEIDRFECVKPIVLRSDIPHTVKAGPNAKFPRIQFSFCFFKEPVSLLY